MKVLDDAAEVMHRIRVKLRRSNLPSAQGAYMAYTANEAVLLINEVCAALKLRGGSTASYDDLVSHARQIFNEIVYQLCNGFAVNTGFFVIQPVIGGYFDTAKGDLQPKQHPVRFRFRELPRLRQIAQHIEVEVAEADIAGRIESFLDGESGAVNGAATPGGLFILRGDKIKVRGNHADTGMFFVSRADPSVRYRVTGRLGENTSRKVAGRVPSLPPGEYYIEVKTQHTTGNVNQQEPRTVESAFTVTVA